MTLRRKIGVVLFQLGGPDSLAAVRPFLYNLFCDPEIIDFPGGWLLRRPLAWYIARRRSTSVAKHYEEIGGRSPILPLTERQARALEAALLPDLDAKCFVAMRYWHPFTQEAIAAIEKSELEEIVLLPLYPQFSFATTGSSLKEWKRLFRNSQLPVKEIREFHRNMLYVAAVAEKISSSFERFENPQEAVLLFSAHGLPQSFIQRGDPYQEQVEETVRRVMAKGGWANEHVICYQSKVGRDKWLEPSLNDTVHRLAREGKTSLLVCPISFVTEHIETLHEIAIETREEALHLGIRQFEMVPALNDSPQFIAALAGMVRDSVLADSVRVQGEK